MNLRSALRLSIRFVRLLRRIYRLAVRLVRMLIHLVTLAVLRYKGHTASSKQQDIVIYNGLEEYHWEFPNQIIKALRFLDEFDPRRARLVHRHLERILDGCVNYRALYFRSQRICQINYQYFRDSIVGKYPIEDMTQDALTLSLASLLVHVATRGRVRTRRLILRSDTQQRIEKLCRLQEAFFYRRIAEGTADLVGRPIDWRTQSSCKPDDESEITVLSRPVWQILSSLFATLMRYLRRSVADGTLDDSDDADQQRNSEYWGAEQMREAQWLEQTPLLSAHLLERAARCYRSRGMLRAAIACYDQLHQVVRSPRSETVCYCAKLLYETRQYERSEELWKQLEEQLEMVALSRFWQSAICRQMGRYEEAQELLESTGLKPDDQKAFSQYLYLDLHRQDYRSAGQRVREMIKAGRLTHDVSDDEFSFRAILPMVSWHLGDSEEYERDFAMVSSARDRWLERHDKMMERRWCLIVDVPESLQQPGSVPGEITILTRIDREIAEKQVDGAVQLAARIGHAMQYDAFDEVDGYLQGLGYGDDESRIRRICWDRLDGIKPLRGTWCVADVRVDRVFLDQGMITDHWIELWMYPGYGEMKMMFLPMGQLALAGQRRGANQQRSTMANPSFSAMMNDPAKSLGH